MDKLNRIFKDFIGNIKKYVDYLMKVDFRELFINVLILLCIFALATFVYIPIGVVKDLIFSFLMIFASLPQIIIDVYAWIFNLVSAIVALIAFIYLFNKRFDDIEELKRQVKEKPVKKDEGNSEKEEIELPKAKKKK